MIMFDKNEALSESIRVLRTVKFVENIKNNDTKLLS